MLSSSHLFHDSIPAEASSLVPVLWSTQFPRIPRGERPGANPRKHFQALLICKKRSVLFPVLSICRVRDALYLLLVRCLWLAAYALRYRTWWRTCCLGEERYVSTEILLTVNWILICKQLSYFQALDLQCILKNTGLQWFCKRNHISRVKHLTS